MGPCQLRTDELASSPAQAHFFGRRRRWSEATPSIRASMDPLNKYLLNSCSVAGIVLDAAQMEFLP